MSARKDPSSKLVKCPICDKEICSKLINEHANACLGDDIICEPENESSHNINKGSKPKTKAQPSWGFLSGYSKNNKTVPVNSKKRSASDIIKSHTPKKVKQVDSCHHQYSKDSAKKLDIHTKTDSNSITDLFKSEDESDNSKLDLNDSDIECIEDLNKTKCLKKSEDRMKKDNNCAKLPPATFISTNKFNNSPIDKPLAEQVRPLSLSEYVGQHHTVGKKAFLHSLLLQCEKVPSMILWGPPGCGKTTLAKIIAKRSKESGRTKFVNLSATSASVSDVKETVKVAKNDMRMFKKKTILFLDEIHRFNKLQQDVLLPHVEDGSLTLIGATTENPSFQVNKALLSRCRVIALEKLEIKDIRLILERALSMLKVSIVGGNGCDDDKISAISCNDEQPHCVIESAAVEALAGLVDGDARAALNGLQLAVESMMASAADQSENIVKITVQDVKDGLQKSHVLYDKKGEEHYNTVSALIKSMRGCHTNAALYWMARMLEGGEDPMFVARRMVIFASEDVGMADPHAVVQAVSTMQACHMIGMPECAHNLAQCCVYLSRAPKSRSCYEALQAARQLVREAPGPQPPVPLHLRNVDSFTLKGLGLGSKEKNSKDKSFLPQSLEHVDFFKPAK